MYPGGHARNTTANLRDILSHKFKLLGDLALKDAAKFIDRFNNLAKLNASELQSLYDFELLKRTDFA
jgi:2-methylcitrate dehydratase